MYTSKQHPHIVYKWWLLSLWSWGRNYFCISVRVHSDANKQNITENGLNNRIFYFLNIQRNMVLGWFRHMAVSDFTLLSSTCWLLTLTLSPQGHKMVFKSSRKPSKHRKEIEQVRILSLTVSLLYIFFEGRTILHRCHPDLPVYLVGQNLAYYC